MVLVMWRHYERGVMELRNDEMLHQISPDIGKIMKNNQRRKNAYITLQLSLFLLMACNIFKNVDIDMLSNKKKWHVY